MLIQGEDLIIYKQKLIEGLTFFDNFCKENDIKYFAVGGTAIGAIRHKGFIPWDDDIDVAMLREDYDRFCSLKSNLLGTQYRIIDYRDNGYYSSGAKFIDNSTTLWEHELNSLTIGAYIDVFPFDVCDGIEVNYQKIALNVNKAFTRLERSKQKSTFSYLVWAFKGMHIPTFIKCIVNVLYYNRIEKKCIKEVIAVENMLRNQKGEYILYYNSFYPLAKELNRKEVFSSTVTMPFENTTIEMPIGYDEYLKNLYGDYMQMPPKEKQIPHHPVHFYNLEERLSIRQIRQRYHDFSHDQ